MKNEFDKSTVGYYLSLTFGAGIAQLVEHYLAKVAVASSSLVARSIFIFKKLENYGAYGPFFGVRRVDNSHPRQHYCESRRRHSQVAKATVCKIVIPSSTLGAASIFLTSRRAGSFFVSECRGGFISWIDRNG